MATHVMPDHNPKGKHNPRRMLLIAGAAGVMAIIFLVSRNSAGAAAAQTATDPSTDPLTGAAGTPSTFADNGGQAAQLGDTVTSLFGQLQTSLDTLNSQLAGDGTTTTTTTPDPLSSPVIDPRTTEPGNWMNPQTAIDANNQTAAYYASVAAAAKTPAGSPSGATVNTTGNARTGQSFTVITKPNGEVLHDYHNGKPPVVVTSATKSIAVASAAGRTVGAAAGKLIHH